MKPKPLLRRTTYGLLGLLAATYLGMGAYLAVQEPKLVYRPYKYPRGHYDKIHIAPPGQPGVQEHWLLSADGGKLNAIYWHHEKPKGVLLFLHGNAGNVSHTIDELTYFYNKFSMSVMAVDYRGYGKSEGEPSEKGLYDDARAAQKWLAEKENVKPSEIVLVGRSMGGAVATELATTIGARILVLWSTFNTLPAVGHFNYPFMPTDLIMKNRFASIDKIGKFHNPVISLHGDNDDVVPLELGFKLFEKANEPKKFLKVTGGDHNMGLPPEFEFAFGQYLFNSPGI